MVDQIDITIVPYSDRFRVAFKVLNEKWIREYFWMEEMDHIILENPKEHIIDTGGYIGVAIWKGQAVGVCALIKTDHDEYDFELSKMGVSAEIQGKGVGRLLGNHIIEQAKKLGAKKLYLDSNTVLQPAIHLYRKLGFIEVKGFSSHYKRSNIRMELTLTNTQL